ncbi:MAG: type II toxin-antitoxin system VapB family antitoxin [Blastocatellales bacterium]
MSQTKNKAKRKSYRLDETTIKRAQRLLGASTETEAIEIALDEVITERERNRKVWTATERLLKSGIQVEDVFGRLEEGQ